MGAWPAEIWNVSRAQLLTLKDDGLYFAPLVKIHLNTLNSHVLEKSPSGHTFLCSAHTNIAEFIFTEITEITGNCYPLWKTPKVCELKKLHLYQLECRNSPWSFLEVNCTWELGKNHGYQEKSLF